MSGIREKKEEDSAKPETLVAEELSSGKGQMALPMNSTTAAKVALKLRDFFWEQSHQLLTREQVEAIEEMLQKP